MLTAIRGLDDEICHVDKSIAEVKDGQLKASRRNERGEEVQQRSRGDDVEEEEELEEREEEEEDDVHLGGYTLGKQSVNGNSRSMNNVNNATKKNKKVFSSATAPRADHIKEATEASGVLRRRLEASTEAVTRLRQSRAEKQQLLRERRNSLLELSSARGSRQGRL